MSKSPLGTNSQKRTGLWFRCSAEALFVRAKIVWLLLGKPTYLPSDGWFLLPYEQEYPSML